MPKKAENKNEEIIEKLDYIGLDLNNVPETLKNIEPLEFRVVKSYEDSKHKQYRYIPVKDIELLLSPTNRLDELEEKYSKASHVYSYIVPEENEKGIIRHTTFLNMIKKVKIEEIKQVEEEQKELNKKIPFKVKYPGNYLWQIYYSENTDKYFMLVPTEDSDYSTFFYLLKKQLEKRRTGKIFVPITHVEYSNKYLKKSEFEDIENYLWLFTKDWPMIYEVYDKKDNLSIHIVGETEVYKNVKSPYKIQLNSKEEASKFYKLIKALFILQTEVPHYYKFETNIDKQGGIEFFLENQKIEYDTLTDFIKQECIDTDNYHVQADNDILDLEEKLKELKTIGAELEIEYLSKEKQISTFLECKKSFFGKVKYFFKYNKKQKDKDIKSKIEETKNKIDNIESKEETKPVDKKSKEIKPKDHYTIEELIDKANEYYAKETQMKNLLMDINALKLKNKNMLKKIENASSYIEEIDKHKKSIFEFWKYSNKDEVASLAEGEVEEINVRKKISKTFDYKEDLENFGKEMDKQQRKKLSKDELDSIFITTTNVLDILNKVKTNEVLPKDMETALKQIKQEAKSEKSLLEKEEFDIFGGRAEDNTKVKFLANKKHRELPKDKYKILDITKNTRQLGYKLTLENVLKNVSSAISKVQIIEDVPIYKATYEEKLNNNIINVFNLNIEQEMKKALNEDGNKISLYKINLPRNSNAIAYTNIVFYDNQNRTLPVGMDLSSSMLFDLSSAKLKQIEKKTFRIATCDDKDIQAKVGIKTVTLFEYEIEEEI